MGSMPGIYFAGLNSGIQWDTLIDELVSIEHRKVDFLVDRRDQLVFERSTSLEVNQRLAYLDGALAKLKLESTFLSKTVLSSDPTRLSAAASTDATEGSYQISIEQLARASTAQSGLNGQIISVGAYLGAGNTAGVTDLTPGVGYEQVRALPETLMNDLVQASNITAGDTITVTGTDGDGNPVNETYTFNGDETDTMERFAQFLIQAFSGTATVTIGFSGEIIVAQSSGAGTLSFDSSTNLVFNDNDFSGSTLNFGTGVSYTDGTGNGYGSTGPFYVMGTGVHELSFTEGLPGYVISSSNLSQVDTLENLGVTDFTLSIDPDSSGSQSAVNVTSIDGKTTIRGLVDIINVTVPDVTAYLDAAGKLVIQTNEGGSDMGVTTALGGITDILFGANISLDTETPDSVNSFGSTTNTNEHTVVDRYASEQGVSMTQKAIFGTEGSSITNLIGGFAIEGGAGDIFTEGVAVVKTGISSELNTDPAIYTRLFGARGISSATSTTSPPLDVSANLDSAGFDTAVTAGTFTINGVTFNIGATDNIKVQDLMAQVNSSSAGVVMEYDGANDRFVIRNVDYGPDSITIGGGGDTSNFLFSAGLRTEVGSALLSGRNKGAVTSDSPLSTAGFDTTPTTGTFTINGVSIYIDSSTDSLKDVIDKINRSGARVTASYSSATDTFSLVQKLDENTTDNYIRVGGALDTSNLLSAVRLTSTPTVETEIGSKRLDAQFTIDGVSYARPTNSPSDIIGGVDFKLLGVTTGNITLTIESDKETAEDALVGFIVEWNKTMEFLNPSPLTVDDKRRMIELTTDEMNQMSFSEVDQYNEERQALLKRDFIANDRTIRRTVDRMRGLLTGIVSNSGRYNSLASMGIETSGGGDAATAIESRGRLIENTTDEDIIRTLLRSNQDLQDAFDDHMGDIHTLFANALTSTAKIEGNKNLNAGVTLLNTLRFDIGDGTNLARIEIDAGYHTMSAVGLAISEQLSDGGISNISVTFGNSYNLILTNALDDGARAQILLQDYSEGTQSVSSELGLLSGSYYGDDPIVAGGVSVRTRNYIDETTTVGGILFERTRSGGAFDRRISDLNDAIERGEESVERYEDRLRREYAALETMLTQYQSQGQFLQQYLAEQQNESE
ncbi:flagellar filament capping protein FliD [bacterium]|nr:flagellar filament capping protein FliD [bacterium]